MRETPQTTARVAIFKPADGQNKDPFGSLLDISLSILIMICSHNQIYFKKSCITLIYISTTQLLISLPIKKLLQWQSNFSLHFQMHFFSDITITFTCSILETQNLFEGSLWPKGQFYLNFFLVENIKHQFFSLKGFTLYKNTFL